MSSKAVSLDEFIAEYRFWGNWEISYTDQTHLPQNEYVKLGDIAIDYDELTAQRYPVLPFTFRPITGEQVSSRFSELEDGQEQAGRAKKFIQDQLVESVMRTGLLRPMLRLMRDQAIQTGFQEILNELSRYHYLILVVDTGAMRRGAISFLHKTLPEVSIWTVVPVFVMTEVQHQVAELSRIWRKIDEGRDTPHPGKCDVLEKRPQVSCISRELNYIRRWRPVELLTAFPELLGQSNGQSTIDRLIIESVKNLKRERGLHRSIYLLTADKDMASLAALEGVDSLHVGVPPLPDKVGSVRYDSRNQTLVLSPVHYLLWDLAQVFSTARMRSQALERQYELVYYSEARGGFFAYDVMEIRGS